MKLTRCLLGAICLFSLANAQTSIGLNVNSFLTNKSHTSESQIQLNSNFTTSDFLFAAGPTLRVILGGGASEVAPTAGFSFSNTTLNDTAISQLGFWLGCGYYFHVVHQGIFTFSLGPDLKFNFYLPPSNLSSDYSHFEINAGVPLNFDFDIVGKLSARVSAYAFMLGYSYKKEVKDVKDEGFSYSLKSILSPEFTLFYEF